MKKLFAPLCLSALALALSGCGNSPDAEQKAPLVKVRTEVITTAPLSINNELSGRIVAPRVAQVSARVAGVILKRVYEEGSEVKRGEVFFLIDPAPFKADLDSHFEGDFSLKLYLGAWPFGRTDPVTGKPLKREVGPWILTAFKWIAPLRRLRGTLLDEAFVECGVLVHGGYSDQNQFGARPGEQQREGRADQPLRRAGDQA